MTEKRIGFGGRIIGAVKDFFKDKPTEGVPVYVSMDKNGEPVVGRVEKVNGRYAVVIQGEKAVWIDPDESEQPKLR